MWQRPENRRVQALGTLWRWKKTVMPQCSMRSFAGGEGAPQNTANISQADPCEFLLFDRKFGLSSITSARPMEEPLMGYGCIPCSRADAVWQHPLHPAPSPVLFHYARKQEVTGEVEERVILTLVYHSTSSKWQLKQYFPDRSKTSDILSPWITSEKLNSGVQKSYKPNNWRIIREKACTKGFLSRRMIY